MGAQVPIPDALDHLSDRYFKAFAEVIEKRKSLRCSDISCSTMAIV